MWDLPGSGLKPMSPALAGGFLTTAPPGKSLETVALKKGRTNLLALSARVSDFFLKKPERLAHQIQNTNN